MGEFFIYLFFSYKIIFDSALLNELIAYAIRTSYGLQNIFISYIVTCIIKEIRITGLFGEGRLSTLF